MAATSLMLELGTAAPDFTLSDAEGEAVALTSFGDARALLVMFICNHCPYVKHIKPELARFARDYADTGLAIVAICSNDAESYPLDSPEEMAEEAEEAGYIFPYLHDHSQQVAKAYRAMCTPEFFLFDGDRRLVYRGQFDSSRPGNGVPVTGDDLRSAVDAVLTVAPVDPEQIPSVGCSIKWKPGNAPDYA